MNIGLVGSTNVGKSTLFNRLIGQFRAIVTDIPGTTRDILHHKTHLENIGEVTFLDSPGLLDFQEERTYIQKIINEADLLIFVIDDTVGMTAKEKHILEYIREKNKKNKTLFVVNKIDVRYKESETALAISDYYELGFDNIVGISAKKGRNFDILLEELESLAHQIKPAKADKDDMPTASRGIPIAIIGKPNSGKSTLLNQILGKPLSKVENVANTTRDYITADVCIKKTRFTIYDTAGINKKGKMHDIVKIAYKKTLDMVKYIRPMIVFMIDATEGISHRDLTIFQEIQVQALPIMFCINKSDLVSKKDLQSIENMVVAHLDFAKYIPVFTISAKTGQNVDKIFTLAKEMKKEAEKRIETGLLNKTINAEYISRPPRFAKNRICKIMYITQTDINAPTFVAFINHKTRANFAFKKRLENSIRRNFRFVGTPIVIKFKDREEKRNEKAEQEKEYELEEE